MVRLHSLCAAEEAGEIKRGSENLLTSSLRDLKNLYEKVGGDTKFLALMLHPNLLKRAY